MSNDLVTGALKKKHFNMRHPVYFRGGFVLVFAPRQNRVKNLPRLFWKSQNFCLGILGEFPFSSNQFFTLPLPIHIEISYA